MSADYELDPVDWITAGAVGEPGRRTFYLQAGRGADVVALVLEKGQVAALAELAQQLLSDAGVTVTPDDLDTGAQAVREPVDAAWRAGELSLGSDDGAQRFLLTARELTDEADEADAGVARFWVAREQMVGLAAHAAYAVAAGARERCQHCGRPIEAAGHVCPAMNGHGRLTV